jgi:hypothetical protein
MTHTPTEDLNWLAQQYVLGELDAAAQEAFEERLASDEEAAAAMASAVQILAALKASAPVPVIATPANTQAALAGWGVAVGVLATAAALSAVWLIPTSRDAVGISNEAADLVAIWAENNPDGPAAMEADPDDEPNTNDDIPDWLLAAVTLEAGESVGDQVLEN